MNTDAARIPIAATVSPEARATLEGIRAFLSAMPATPQPRTQEDFDAAAARGAIFAEQLGQGVIAALGTVATERRLGGIPTLDVVPRDFTDDGSVIVYVHGGGFVTGSARANLATAALAAASSGRRVVSVDYTLAPRATYGVILDQVAAVWSALLSDGADAARMGLFGDSAGGCIVAAATLLLRDRGAPAPAAIVMLSPVTDIAGEGDTTVTLAHADYLDGTVRDLARSAYAPGADLSDPLVSPVFGDFAKGFPPALIQAGTREILLSDSVRLHRRLRAVGCRSRLELYEGMPHVFQSLLADAPEGREAWAEMTTFWGGPSVVTARMLVPTPRGVTVPGMSKPDTAAAADQPAATESLPGASPTTRPARRPQAERSADTRAKLIQAAVTCLHRTGYSATTVSTVAAEAGVSRGAMTHQFPAKTDLMLAVVEAVFSADAEVYNGTIAQMTAGDWLVALPETMWSVMSAPSGIAVMEIMLASRSDPDLGEQLRRLQGRIDARAHVWSEERIRAAGLEPHPEAVAIHELYVAAVRGLALESTFMKNSEGVHRSLAVLSEMMRRFYPALAQP